MQEKDKDKDNEEMQKKLKKIQELAKEGKIEFAPDYEISDFCYEFVEKVTRIDSFLITNESSLYDFEPDIESLPDDMEKYWFCQKPQVTDLWHVNATCSGF